MSNFTLLLISCMTHVETLFFLEQSPYAFCHLSQHFRVSFYLVCAGVHSTLVIITIYRKGLRIRFVVCGILSTIIQVTSCCWRLTSRSSPLPNTISLYLLHFALLYRAFAHWYSCKQIFFFSFQYAQVPATYWVLKINLSFSLKYLLSRS